MFGINVNSAWPILITLALVLVTLALGAMQAVASTATPEFVYTANQIAHNVSAYKINPATGALQEVRGSPYPAGKFPISVAVDPSGHFAYVANNGAGDISAYTVDAKSGVLHLVDGSPFASGKGPYSLVTTTTH